MQNHHLIFQREAFEPRLVQAYAGKDNKSIAAPLHQQEGRHALTFAHPKGIPDRLEGASDREDGPAEGLARQTLRNRLAHVQKGTRVPALTTELLNALLNTEEPMTGEYALALVEQVTPIKDLDRRSAFAIAQALCETRQLLARQGDPLKADMVIYVAGKLNEGRPVAIVSPKLGNGVVKKSAGENRFTVMFGAEAKILILHMAVFAITDDHFLSERIHSRNRENARQIAEAGKLAANRRTLRGYLRDSVIVDSWGAHLPAAVFQSLVSRLLSIWNFYIFRESSPNDLQQFSAIAGRLFQAARLDLENLQKAHERESETLLSDPEKTERRQVQAFMKRNEELAPLGESFIERHADVLIGLEKDHSGLQGDVLDLDSPLDALFKHVLPYMTVDAELDKHFDSFITNLNDLVQLYSRVNSEFNPEDLSYVAHDLIDRLGIPGIADYGDALVKALDVFGGQFGSRGEEVLMGLMEELEPMVAREGTRAVLGMLAGLLGELKLGPDEARMFAEILPRIPFTAATLPKIVARARELSLNHLLPLPALIASTLSPEEVRERIKRIQEGGFDLQDDVDTDLNYMLLRAEIQQTRPVSSRESYGEFMRMVGDVRDGKYSPGQSSISGHMLLQVRGMVYEAYLLRRKILEWKKRADDLGRALIVVENLSYGAVVTSPITEERDGNKYISGTTIPVWSTKVGSTESHEHEDVMVEDLFSGNQMAELREKQPLVVVVDASTSVSDPKRTSAHVPDGFKGYRNEFIALNVMMGFPVDLRDFAATDDLALELVKNPIYRRLVSKPAPHDPSKTPYKMYFYYPGEKTLYLREDKKISQVAPKLVNNETLTGPSIIFVQAAIEPEAVPTKVATEFMGGRHTPAYFDDQDHYKEFFMDYEPSYGFHVARSYILRSRLEYEVLLKLFGEDPPLLEASSSPMSGADRDVDTVVLDLDGTIATTDQPLSRRTIVILAGLLAKGKRIIIETEDIERNVDRRARKLIELLHQTSPERLKNLWFATDGATVAYRFISPTRKAGLGPYNEMTRIPPAQKQQVLALLDQSLHGQFRIDTRESRISSEHRIDLHEIRDRDQFIQKTLAILSAKGLPYHAYKTGGTSVKLVLKHKPDLLRYLADSLGLQEANMLIVGDSARTNQIDRRLLAEFPGAVSINVGKASRSIGQINRNIIQTEAGIEGSLRVLEGLIQFSKLLMRPLLPYQALFQKSAYENGGSTSHESGMEAGKAVTLPASNAAPQSIVGKIGPRWFYGIVIPLMEELLRAGLNHWIGIDPAIWLMVGYPIIHVLLHIPVDVHEVGWKGFFNRAPGRFALSFGFGSVSWLTGMAGIPSSFFQRLLPAWVAHSFNNVYLADYLKRRFGWSWLMMSTTQTASRDWLDVSA